MPLSLRDEITLYGADQKLWPEQLRLKFLTFSRDFPLDARRLIQESQELEDLLQRRIQPSPGSGFLERVAKNATEHPQIKPPVFPAAQETLLHPVAWLGAAVILFSIGVYLGLQSRSESGPGPSGSYEFSQLIYGQGASL